MPTSKLYNLHPTVEFKNPQNETTKLFSLLQASLMSIFKLSKMVTYQLKYNNGHNQIKMCQTQ